MWLSNILEKLKNKMPYIKISGGTAQRKGWSKVYKWMTPKDHFKYGNTVNYSINRPKNAKIDENIYEIANSDLSQNHNLWFGVQHATMNEQQYQNKWFDSELRPKNSEKVKNLKLKKLKNSQKVEYIKDSDGFRFLFEKSDLQCRGTKILNISSMHKLDDFQLPVNVIIICIRNNRIIQFL